MHFPSYYTKPQEVVARIHKSKEKYHGTSSEIVPLKHMKGERVYVMMQPYVQEPIVTLSVGLYAKPKKYADQESPIGQAIGQPKIEGFREAQVGSAQAWFYPEDKTIVIWECFFDARSRRHPFSTDRNMQKLWTGFEHWLVKRFPDAETIATPFNDPIARTIEEYQEFLRGLGYAPIAKAAFGKKVAGGAQVTTTAAHT